MYGPFHIPGYLQRCLEDGARAAAEYVRSGPHAAEHAADVIEACLPDLTLVSLDDAVILRCMVYGVTA